MQSSQTDYFMLGRPNSPASKPCFATENHYQCSQPKPQPTAESKASSSARPEFRSLESTQAIAQHKNTIDRIAKVFAG
ncbi:hypothetical protein CC2G_011830 [Coprinopsis cinerea AmutBmut pab1-1]|nr:hypothetical protein CC2G_011830 [Coprinopsis cinerea AmutBmut pab1-1]